MLKSMTGFGRGEAANDRGQATVEIKTVNHRYLDINIRIVKKLNCFESDIRNLLKEYISRGKVDIFITYEDTLQNNVILKYNSSLAKAYVDYCKQMASELEIDNDITTTKLMTLPEIFMMEQNDEVNEDVWFLIKKCIEEAAKKLTDSRKKEGEHLKQDLSEKLDNMLELVNVIEERSPIFLEEYRTRLEEKIKELLEKLGTPTFDESRILTEVAIMADKVCVDEEIVRLKSHIKQMKANLCMEDSVGRKLDFITQELNREANTILSKANDLEICDVAIKLKTEIEKIREQVQNIE